MNLLLAERRALDTLVKKPNCQFKMVLWPTRAYEEKYLAIRYANLLTWLEKVQDKHGIEFVCGPYSGPNRLIVMGKFLIEGFKLHDHPGYEMSVVKYQREQIENAAAEFHEAFGKSQKSKDPQECNRFAIQQIGKLATRHKDSA